MLIGDRRPYVTALVVPHFEPLEKWAQATGIAIGGRDQLLAHPEVQKLFEQEIATRTGDLARFEQVKKFVLLEREFGVDSGELTPTLKVRRKIVNQRYAEQIESMYGSEARAEAS